MCPSARAEACSTAHAPTFLVQIQIKKKNDLHKHCKTTSTYYFRTINKSILHKIYIFRSSHKISNTKMAIIKKFVFETPCARLEFRSICYDSKDYDLLL